MSVYGEKRPKVLITGASGFLGHALCRAAAARWQVCGLYHRHIPRVAGIEAIRADLVREADLDALIGALRPRVLIHAAAAAQVNLCQDNPGRTEDLNVHVPARLAGICARRGCGFVLLSTDLVFDGRAAPYREESATHPLSAYGRQKRAAEIAVLSACPRAAVLRLPLMIGAAPYSDGNFCQQMLAGISRGQPLDLFTDEFRTPIDTRSAAEGILALADGRATGVLHLGGRTRISRYSLGLMMAQVLNARPEAIRPASIAAVTPPRAADTSLDSRAAYALGFDPAPLDQAVARAVVDFKALGQTQKNTID